VKKVVHGGHRGRAIGLVCAAALAAAVQLAPISSVRAAEPVSVVGGSWYWEPQIATLNTPAGPVALPTGPLPTPDVPAGDFAVTAILGQANKESYIHLDSSAIPKGSSVQQLSLTIKEDAGGINVLASMAKITAHPVISFFTDGTAAGLWTARPSFDPSVSGPGTRGADGTWKFDLTALAQKWADGSLANNGIALVASGLMAPETWQVVWSGSAPRPIVEGLITRPPAEPASNTGTTPAEQASPSDTAATDVVIAPDATVEPAAQLPAVAPAAPAGTASAPLSTEPLPPTVRLYQPAAQSGKPKRAPPATFYLAGVALVVLLLVGGIALGERGEPHLERRGSVLRTLERRNDPNA
jgi:hypothetical protein